MTLYFKDNFFSAGRTEIFNSSKERVGELDLKSAFSSSVDVLDPDGNPVVSGKFVFLSNKWRIIDKSDQEIGLLIQKLTFLSKKYKYDAYGRGTYLIESKPFSDTYDIFDEQENLIARFENVSVIFESSAYQLSNYSEKISSEELIAVVMGINAIGKRRSSNASASG